MFPKKIVDAENYTVIKNGVDYDKHSFKPEVRTELRKKYGLENNFVLGHVGRFNVQKNHEFLIDIFYEVYKHDNSARLFLVGIGETENQIKEKPIQKNIIKKKKKKIFLCNQKKYSLIQE